MVGETICRRNGAGLWRVQLRPETGSLHPVAIESAAASWSWRTFCRRPNTGLDQGTIPTGVGHINAINNSISCGNTGYDPVRGSHSFSNMGRARTEAQIVKNIDDFEVW
jgi:hypothetical protein